MKDIKSLGTDATLEDKSDKYKALNLLAVQLGEKNYAPDFGIDLDFFINSEYTLTKQSLTSHIMKRLADYSISVVNVGTEIDEFTEKIQINIKDK